MRIQKYFYVWKVMTQSYCKYIIISHVFVLSGNVLLKLLSLAKWSDSISSKCFTSREVPWFTIEPSISLSPTQVDAKLCPAAVFFWGILRGRFSYSTELYTALKMNLCVGSTERAYKEHFGVEPFLCSGAVGISDIWRRTEIPFHWPGPSLKTFKH